MPKKKKRKKNPKSRKKILKKRKASKIKFKKKVSKPQTDEIIYKTKKEWVKNIALVKQSRLSVMPIDTKCWKIILNMGSIE